MHKVHVYIDASNLWQAQKTKGQTLDMKKLLNYLKDKHSADEIQVFYYTAYPAADTRNYDTSRKHAFYTYLKKGLGFTVRKKELKRIPSEESAFEDGLIEKGNMDVELAIDAVHNVKNFDTAVLFTGDSDFLALVKYIKARDKKVYVYSSQNNISSELRTGANGYVDILKIEHEIWRDEIKFKDQKNK